MKRIILLVISSLLIIGTWWSLPVPRPHALGYYTWNGTIWCTSRASCLHEVGHALDDRAGWISSELGFIAAMENYTIARTRRSDGRPDAEALRELYADIFAGAEGKAENMPEPFREFYDWPRAAELIEEYVP